MKELLNTFKNVKQSPRTSSAGLMLMIFGGYLIYSSEADLTYLSIEVGLFLLGLYFFLEKDENYFVKGKENCEINED